MKNYREIYKEALAAYRENSREGASEVLNKLKKSELLELAEVIRFTDVFKKSDTKQYIVKTLVIHCVGWDIDREIIAEVMREVRQERKMLLGY